MAGLCELWQGYETSWQGCESSGRGVKNGRGVNLYGRSHEEWQGCELWQGPRKIWKACELLAGV